MAGQDITPAEAYQKAFEALNNARQEFRDKTGAIDNLEKELKETKGLLQKNSGELETIKQQLQITITEFETTKNELQSVDTLLKSQLQSVDALLSKGLSDIQSIKQGPLAPGTEIVREVHPLALATNDEFIDVNGQWIAVTRPVYSTYDYTATLPGTQRKYKLIVRQANDGQAPRGDVSKYRLFYPWVNNADNTEYPGNLNWGSLDEGGWDTITLDHITNPFNQDKHGNSYWRLEGFTSNCTNRVFSVTLMVVDIIS
ncbi:hypothetical protein F7734_23330 [Scytonema sp. UIC 10036]|uniref:hypothetical protein n=1 Tax=Scytonema sp. UIC 10036 TaxID=2304196 RepID=UPI0012DA1CD6|nr:hypothetical protein [Scytonema sp. UIC 10036]MUG95133.1 hypothetical protein [Scytonema sp. UIC 10036]